MTVRELALPHEIIYVDYSLVKTPPYTDMNPNGRLPIIEDPNTGITLWESGAIIEYLVETYDKDGKLGFPKGSKEAWQAKMWLFFQVSGQGPYYGQAHYFTKKHHEPLAFPIERYTKEIRRVTSVLEEHLKTQPKGEDGPWLVGGKFSFADLSFVPWQYMTYHWLADVVDITEYTLVADWIARAMKREAIGPVMPGAMTPHKGN
ncbi:hypothetical protein AA0115_g11938 [Alternaria tenuissima]|uniref:Glutathione S-transferase n=1 Tax=Alternaria tenuissima TaxID=119927 RepID=A0AB37W266_9PLEO|nr:hypothetical protein AA0115_g11938 [Alternaria tenuissima]